MSTATIQFEGLKETKEKKVKEEVNCLISMDGETEIPVKSLSGGERSSTDLAIDLSVMEFIQDRAGRGCSLLVLDEPFGGLDESNILSIMELLRESKINKQILIVDHNPVAKQTFESKITVIRDGLTSKVVQ
jgi:DNA repair exonuclease SbcCD ATPase subunit